MHLLDPKSELFAPLLKLLQKPHFWPILWPKSGPSGRFEVVHRNPPPSTHTHVQVPVATSLKAEVLTFIIIRPHSSINVGRSGKASDNMTWTNSPEVVQNGGSGRE